ncbi:hypothetical protein AK812_SmicGene314 [Symbiodinium microadriaticum]|uniref:Uncharacterized protein n=1 Tax=Symbiodinium microadriaticum TaxID=2951 RepID=A0A1Q9F702_SYMMI|nr:hypothetical protein AK812_SmicGene314 [Symbiodinium microadriaticum]
MATISLLVLLYSFVAAEANTGTGTGCYNVETHQCDCTVSESTCHARGGTWTDTCRSCDSTTNEQHPDCQRQYSWGCFDEASHACECTVSEKTCEAAAGKTWTHELVEWRLSISEAEDATWSHQCFDCDVDAETSAAGRPTGFVVALLVLLSGFFLADANTGTGTGCYDVETHRCDCTVTETQCLARQGHWTDTCRSCDATTNEQHPDCQRQYSWGCFDEASHACQCTVSERACDAAAGKTWTHECNLYEGACALDFPDATWSHQCFECEEDAVQKDEAASDDGGVGVAVAVSRLFFSNGLLGGIRFRHSRCGCCMHWYNSPQFNQSDVVVGLAVPGSAPSVAATPKEVA